MKIRVLLSLFLLSTCALRSTHLEIVTGSFVDLEVMESASPEVTSLRVTGEAPRFILRPLGGAALSPNQQILSFDYFCPDGVRSVYVLYSRNVDSGWDASKSVYGGSLGRAEAWQPFASDLKAGSSGKWSHEFQAFIIQMEMPLGTEIQLRNFAVLDGSGSKGLGAEIGMERKFQEAEAIDAYLNANYTNAEINCAISENQVGVLGSIREAQQLAGRYYLKEFEPHENAWEAGAGTLLEDQVVEADFRVLLDRYIDGRDRIAHRFAIVHVDGAGNETRITPAVWPTNVARAAKREMPRLRPNNQIGLGGVTYRKAILEKDFADLGIQSSTVNIVLQRVLAKHPGGIAYEHQGKTWHFNPAAVREYDRLIKKLTEMNVVVSAILLVAKVDSPLVHPEYDPAGTYSMVNLTSREGADAYRAVVSFLAERYSRPDQQHGWISHWIVFNEVDYGWVWTNMGEQPMARYMDAYQKAMRLTWLEVRQFNPTGEVFISLTHNWDYTPRTANRSYPPRELMDRLGLYSQVTGEYHWGVAYHPYPQSLLRPRTWEDRKAFPSFNTPYITMKNIEVLVAYLEQPQFLYYSKPRTILLSEQGYHTPDYSEKSLRDKAAAIAYTWKKMEPFKNIEAFHYHRWIDNPNEGSLRVGLRTLPTKEHPHGERKQPAFKLYGMLGTARGELAMDQFLPDLGISDWSEIRIQAEDITR